MVGRSRDEEGRSATPLELFFDLVFVVAVAFAAAAMHHHVVEGVVGESIVRYLQVFFAIWWAWMNFTWFASAYDTDDVPYRRPRSSRSRAVSSWPQAFLRRSTWPTSPSSPSATW
jgi:low temperature requirement protein LtrA